MKEILANPEDGSAAENVSQQNADVEPASQENVIAEENLTDAAVAEDVSPAEMPDFSVVLDEISHSEPQVTILNDYLSVSSNAELRRLDVAKFLSFENGAVATRDVTLRRRSLHLILCAENLVRTAAVNNGLNFEQQEEARSLIEEMQTVGSGLSLAMYEVAGDADKEKTNCLLYAANNLLSARLRLNPLIDKQRPFADKSVKNEPVNSAPNQPKPISAAKTPVKPPKKVVNKSRVKPGRWLVAAAVLICAVGAAFYIVASLNETASANVRQAADVDLQRLRGGENLVIAKVNNETLIGVTAKEWKDLPLEKKNEQLRQMIGDGSQHHYKSVLLLNSRGDVVATGTEKQITLK